MAVLTGAPTVARAQPFDCSSSDPARWPQPAKPYFMVGFDTSGSMDELVAGTNSCGYAPNDRLAHGRCALKNAVLAYSGQVNFGLASFARSPDSCTGATCFSGCNSHNIGTPGASEGGTGCPVAGPGCGPEPTPGATNSSSRAGANILVPMLKDTTPPPASNVPDLLSWVDNDCTGSRELFHDGCTPLNGLLRDMFRYYATQWAFPGTGVPTYASPLTSAALGERGCRSVNVIFITDGGETCDVPADAVDAAADLLAGFDKDGFHWSVRTFVVDFGGVGAAADALARAGGTTAAYAATNEVELSIALANIIGSAARPEVCNNADDNCNGCIDEGYRHYCDIQPVAGNCCTGTRATCLANYQASITAAAPNGNLALLPCTTRAQSLLSDQWLCFDPKEQCDSVDNNCSADSTGLAIDEGVTKCGSPLHCPVAETCNSLDDDCDGFVDEGVCSGCVPSAETCDGCDNDCDGIADNGITPIPCGLDNPANCRGTLSCNAPRAVPIGGCVAGGGFGTCSNAPQTEVCDGIDNNCDGAIDNGVASTACVPAGTSPTLVFGGTSQCRRGTQPCNGTCQGFVGPSAEVCDGIDNDCDGVIDNTAFGVGLPCGVNQRPCTPGVTACVSGAIVCQGGVPPQVEICDGVDNNCNGAVDDAPLADSPAPTANGCWPNAGNCCRFPATGTRFISWCPPPGAGCNDNGTLTPPCNRGTLACAGGAWICSSARAPTPDTCDGIDNDCDGLVDDNPVAPVGDTCGSDTGDCQSGTIVCTAGVIDCVGDIPPTMETCDGRDNDCDGVIDNGVVVGGACFPEDPNYPTPPERNHFPCVPGTYVCDASGNPVCVGGVGPSPEICDGIDNDCDGMIDETGPAPDGIDGSENRNPPPDAAIGDACGVDSGECEFGAYACVNGAFSCVGGRNGVPEKCDCLDNNCDGNVDNPPTGSSLCTSDKQCVQAGKQCECAAPCGDEFPCPPGQRCETVTASGSSDPTPLGRYCVTDYDAICGDCTAKTATNAAGEVICAPAGTTLPDCSEPPVCTCKQQNGCREPCFGVTCAAGETCTNYGPTPGRCTNIRNCWLFPCPGCDNVCHDGACFLNPCVDGSCPADQECRPSADFSSFECVPSCANVTCDDNQECVDGVCKPACGPCASDQVCDASQTPPTCVTNRCAAPLCADGSCCDPVTGACGDCPCAGVVCPDEQTCRDGSCYGPSSGEGGNAATGSGGGSTSSTAASGGTGGSGGASGPSGVWGLATGGGGCACELGAGATSSSDTRWPVLALALGWLGWRRRSRRGKGRQPCTHEAGATTWSSREASRETEVAR